MRHVSPEHRNRERKHPHGKQDRSNEEPLTPEELAGDGEEVGETGRRARRGEGARSKPSQAEGNRETVEEDIRSREAELERAEHEAERKRRERRR